MHACKRAQVFAVLFSNMRVFPTDTSVDARRQILHSFIEDTLVKPRMTARHWSSLTGQTANMRSAYVSQHLASLLCNVRGTGSAARGDDLADGTEVKSCSRIYQLDKCRACKGRVFRYDDACRHCGSRDVLRNNDSKWLIAIRSKEELQQVCNLPRIVFILEDYPGFAEGNYEDMRILAYVVYPRENVHFQELMRGYYELVRTKQAASKKQVAPKNLWPFSPQFYRCNPVKVFECIIRGFETPDYSFDYVTLPTSYWETEDREDTE